MIFYSVVQVVPNTVRGELMNVGVVAFDLESGQTEWRTLRNWSRVRTFVGTESASFERTLGELVASLRADQVETVANEWNGVVRLTRPRASTVPIATLAEQMARLMLKDAPARRRTIRKTAVVREATVNLHRVFTREVLREVRVESNREVTGAHANHQFDLAVSNGHVLLAAQAISFDRPQSRDVEKDVNEIAWLLDDVGRSLEPPRLTVLVVPPLEKRRDDFLEASKLFKALRAEVVPLKDVPSWADELPDDLRVRMAVG